jgi:2-polyprenyl-6-methoxyphenol hydroxylase-like FAD-dependent oxidoreductase
MPCIKVVPRRWVGHGAALLGDAAHALNPHVAQGRNQALEDAVTLDAVLDSCFASGNFSRQALSLYERIRNREPPSSSVWATRWPFWNTGGNIGLDHDRVFTLGRNGRRPRCAAGRGALDRSIPPDRVRALGWPR